MKLVLSTCSADEADRLARAIVQERLAACCNVVPGVRSTYWWEGKLTTEDEVLLVFKTRDDGAEQLMVRIGELHPYETPEIVVVAADGVTAAYAAWVDGEVRTP